MTAKLIKNAQIQIEQDLALFLSQIDMPENLKQAVLYASLSGGKRVRPALVYAAFQTASTNSKNHKEKSLSICTANTRRAALAVELLHCYSLVHDDLPCMDDDDLRRGKPTCHIVHGEAVALLAGDILQTLAFEALTEETIQEKTSETAQEKAQQIAKLLTIFTPRARRMVTGQMRDLNAENYTEQHKRGISQHELERIHADKTGALIEAAVLMGGVCANASQTQQEKLLTFASKLGLAFQVQDDILDITATTEELGKPAGSDEKLDKATYPKLMGLADAKNYATTLFLEAKQALEADFSENNPLVNLADWLWHRKS